MISHSYMYIGPVSTSSKNCLPFPIGREVLSLTKSQAGPGSTPKSVPSLFSTSSGLDKQAETGLVSFPTAVLSTQLMATR